MQERARRRLRLWAVLTGVGAVAGAVYMPFVSPAVTPGMALLFAAQGVLVASLLFGFELFVAQGPASASLRRAPFAAVFVVKALATTALIMLAYGIGALLLFPDRFAQANAVHDLARDTGYAFAVSLLLQFVLMVRTVVGGRVLVNLLLGRYHRPLAEERAFMFIDVAGSTALAERLGGVGAYAMISRFFFDVAQETARFGGETHEYVGDAVIVTWPLDEATGDTRCLDCYFAIRDRMARRATAYAREFGSAPQFRASLHGGPIVAGECGDDRREIVYFGDAINTAARIQEACKERDRPFLVSADLLSQIALSPAYAATSLGAVKLRGREKEIELFAVERREDGEAAQT